jgi:hypothetical protein
MNPYLLLPLLVLLLTSCGSVENGSTGSASVSGIAAAGAPIVGQVFLVDANGEAAASSPVTIGNDGNFTIDVSGLTAPFFLQAIGKPRGSDTTMTLFSATPSAGTANVNPLSTVIVAVASGGENPATVFSDPVSHAGSITTTSLQNATSSMRTMISQILADFGAATIDPIRDSVPANAEGLDALFDTVSFQLDTTLKTLTIVDRSGSIIGTSPLSELAQHPVTVLPTPTVVNVEATPGSGEVTLTWNSLNGASAYAIYFGTSSSVSKTVGAKIFPANSPERITGLNNGTTYYFVVTGFLNGRETIESAAVAATPFVSTQTPRTTTPDGTPTTSPTITTNPPTTTTATPATTTGSPATTSPNPLLE